MKSVLTALALLISPALAGDTLSAGLSQDSLQITSTFAGSDLIVFGAVSNPVVKRDIVVVVRGPETVMTVRRKDHVAGLWINTTRARLKMPSYYFVAATGNLAAVAGEPVRRRYELGLDRLRADAMASDGDPAPYAAALIRGKRRAGLYVEANRGVEMRGPTLFRVHVPIPASVPRGTYAVEVYVLRGGAVVASQSTPFFVNQAGFERRVFEFAHTRPLTYGLLTVLMAVLLGWLSSLLFRART
jgi:uncharacterized protein (TIGR02186 family)